MGQYYLVVNKTKKEFLDPHSFGHGAKLMEFVSDDKGMLQALAILLADGNGRGGGDLSSNNPLIGSWSGDEITIVGDYADNGLYNIADETYEDISVDSYCLLLEDHWFKQEFESEIRESMKDKTLYLTSGQREVIQRVFPDWKLLINSQYFQ